MLTEPLTDAEIAEFRAYLGRCKVPAQSEERTSDQWMEQYARQFFNAMPRLLDEVERSREDLASLHGILRSNRVLVAALVKRLGGDVTLTDNEIVGVAADEMGSEKVLGGGLRLYVVASGNAKSAPEPEPESA